MKYYLMQSYQDFWDPHGTPDEGQHTVDVTTSEDLGFEPKKGGFYDEDNELTKEEDEHYGEDGYNCETNEYTYEEIGKEEYDKYSVIIAEYNNLLE